MRDALTFSLVIFTSVLLAVPTPAHAQTQVQAQPQAQTQVQAPAPAQTQAQASDGAGAIYKPPLRGAPARRVGGATRGSSETDMVLNVLAPDQTGLTTQAQPTLYWYASRPTSTLIELTLISDTAEAPLLSKNLVVTPGGVQAIDLATYGITLALDTEYEWFVSVVSNASQRSKDMTSGGTIRRVAPDPAVVARVAAAGERAAPRIYAEAGLWYDAIASLSRQIERSPADAELRSLRAALLEQIGLPAAAAADRSTRR